MPIGDPFGILRVASAVSIASKSTVQEFLVTYIITDNCIKDELCIQACPADCIHPRSDEADFQAATQAYVNPAECIDCGACVPACTSNAIFPLDEVPADKQQFIAVNEAHFA